MAVVRFRCKTCGLMHSTDVLEDIGKCAKRVQPRGETTVYKIPTPPREPDAQELMQVTLWAKIELYRKAVADNNFREADRASREIWAIIRRKERAKG